MESCSASVNYTTAFRSYAQEKNSPSEILSSTVLENISLIMMMAMIRLWLWHHIQQNHHSKVFVLTKWNTDSVVWWRVRKLAFFWWSWFRPRTRKPYLGVVNRGQRELRRKGFFRESALGQFLYLSKMSSMKHLTLLDPTGIYKIQHYFQTSYPYDSNQYFTCSYNTVRILSKECVTSTNSGH